MSNTAVLDENGIATVAGDITVYHYDEETREYTSSSVEYLALGVGTPAHSCADAPPEAISGYVVCRTATLNGWEHVPDHRGETVYSTENGNPVLITQPGDYPADTTTKQPATPWDTWNGEAWVTDTERLTAKGTVQLSSAINSTSEILAATPKAVKAAYDLANGKQPADATLTALAGLATAADRLPYFTGADRAALATLTAIGRAIIAKGSIKDVLNYLGLGEGSALPVGVPVPWPTATPPAGWLKCDGRAFTKEQYPVLARVYPTLRLPDLRGEFIRGWDDGRKVDTGRSLLSGQAATFIRTALQDYYGYDLNTNVKVGIAFATADSVITVGNPANPKAGNNSDYVPASADNSITGIQRTAEDNFTGAWISMRPRNVAFNYIVRAA
ncbi:phage tail protein [Escherichia coli]|nr:phage tail protein [Escherichia coli]